MTPPHPVQKAGGVSFAHEAPETLPILAAPSTKGKKNAIRMELIPVACWRVNDVRFEFGSSFLLPDVQDEFTVLAELCKSHAGAPLSIFGHADPVGDESLNRALSGRRAEAVYGVLTRDVDRWEKLYSSGPATSNNWGQPAISVMEKATGKSAGTTKRTKGADCSLHRLPLPRQRRRAVYRSESGLPGKGNRRRRQGRLQGCSEFNPVLIFSSAEQTEFNKPQNQAARNEERQEPPGGCLSVPPGHGDQQREVALSAGRGGAFRMPEADVVRRRQTALQSSRASRVPTPRTPSGAVSITGWRSRRHVRARFRLW